LRPEQPLTSLRSRGITIFTLKQLHAELAGKFVENRNAGIKIKTAMNAGRGRDADAATMTARDITDKLAALRKRDGGMVVGEGAPARWRLKEAANSVGFSLQMSDARLRVMC